MSIFFDFNVNTSRMFRRAVDEDKTDIELFWNREETATLFHADDVGRLIEMCTLSICMLDQNKRVTGFLALSDHPPLPAIDPAHWEGWIRNMFQKYYLSHNTLFIHFMCCMETVSDFFLEEALTSVFLNDFFLHHIILVVPSVCKVDCTTKYAAFRRRTIYKHCTKYDDKEHCISLFVAARKDICPKLKVRRAVEEDNDEIVQILDKNKRIRDMYGDYYISEILARHPESKRTIIVAEENSKVVGVMCLSTIVNYSKLQNIYELGPYYGLLEADHTEQTRMKRNNPLLRTFGDPITLGKWSPFEEKICKERTQDKSEQDDVTSRVKQTLRSKRSRVNFRAPTWSSIDSTELQGSQESDRPGFSPVPSMSIVINPSMMAILDDEPFDYEIVNIDNHLLVIPEVVSVSNLSKPHHLPRTSSTVLGNRKKKNSQSQHSKSVIKYKGKPNAFLIELFGMSDQVDDRRGFDLLEAAFEAIPDYDYCIIRMPTALKSFRMLHYFCFVPPKSQICSKHALYVAHRNSIVGKFRVRKAEYIDIPQIAMLLHNLDGKQTIRTIEHTISHNNQHMAFILLCGSSVVGVGILDPPNHIEVIKAKFVVDEYQKMKYHVTGNGVDCGFAMLKTALAYPAFEPHFAFFAREMMRQTACETLMWLTAYRNKLVAHKANTLVTVMTPLPYRKTADSGLSSEIKHAYKLSKSMLSFSAWFLSKKLTSIPKLNIDTRICVVGASRTAISFLIKLLFDDSSTYLNFTNVTLVSTNGLPYVRHPLHAASIMFPRHQSTTDRFLKSTPFTYYVNVVQGTMVEIDKRDKFIVTDSGKRLYYDMLFLLIGKQYQHPDYLKSVRKKERDINHGNVPEYVRMDNPSYFKTQEEPKTEYSTPENVFFINTIADAHRALKFVKNIFRQFGDFKICVYGGNIEAYCCISGLLEIDVPPESINFIEPFPPEDETKPRVPVFCNQNVDETVQKFLECLNITTYRGFYFHSWKSNNDNVMYSVDFLSRLQYLNIECAAFFYYGKRSIDPHAFVAINRCGLPYDGGILIDHRFRTNNSSIYAAGPTTRYHRRYDDDNLLQKFFDSYEVGKMLAKQIRDQLDPLLTNEKREEMTLRTSLYRDINCSDGMSVGTSISSHSLNEFYDLQVPKFKKPLVWYCLLPGSLQYLEVRSPGVKFPHHYIQSLDYNGYVLETFVSGYFKLHLTKDLRVNGITCLTRAKYSIENFKRLYGLSSVMLNNVYMRFQAGKIKDFYDFFRLPWSIYIYNERSDQLLELVKNVRSKKDPQGKSVVETVYVNSKDMKDGVFDLKAKFLLRTSFEKSGHFEAIADFLMEWLTDHELVFPMYITPGRMLEFSFDSQSNPAFKRRKKSMTDMLASTIS